MTGILCAQSAESYSFANHISDFILGGTASVAIYILLMIGLAVLFYKWSKILDWFGHRLTGLFVLAWVFGFVVYDIGMCPDEIEQSGTVYGALLGVAPMAIIHAFEMFILQSDVSAIHSVCHDHIGFMIAFSLAHFLAAFISMVFVIKHFGFNIIANIIHFYKVFISRRKFDDLFVFWGVNDATYYLAKDIIKTQNSSNYRIIIIRIKENEEEQNQRIGMERLFSFLTLTNRNLSRLQELQKAGCLTTSTFSSLTHLERKDNGDILKRELHLSNIVRLMERTTKTVHFLLLGEDEAFNIQAVANLKTDSHVVRFADEHKTAEPNSIAFKFYCHARYNSIHRVIEDDEKHPNIRVKVVDTSHISVELLKRKWELQPVNYVNVEKDATVSSPFNALVVGFGEVGLDSVRFLYEFGSFVKEGSTEDNVLRSDFHCDVIDKKMDELAGLFVANAPNIHPDLAFKNDGQPGKSLITLHKMDCFSVDFYQLLENRIKDLNYVIVATENDEANISLAVRIFRLAMRYRKNMEHLCIMVRIKHDENGHLHNISFYYNQLLKAEENANDKKGEHQNVILKTNRYEDPIRNFGLLEDAFTYENIICNAIEEEGRKFFKAYNNDNDEWDKRHRELMQTVECQYESDNKGMCTATANQAPTFTGVMSLRRKESQDLANSLHIGTKKALLDKATKKLGQPFIVNEVKRVIKNGDETFEINYSDSGFHPIDGGARRILDVLAQTEHLRWNASHEILGYVEAEHKNEARLQHNCLKPWQKLTSDYKSYDYNVVDVSLGIERVYK